MARKVADGPWWVTELTTYWGSGETTDDTQRAVAAALRTVGDLHAVVRYVSESAAVSFEDARQMAAITIQGCGLDTSHIDNIGKIPPQLLADMLAAMRHHMKPGIEADVAKAVTGLFVAALKAVPWPRRAELMSALVGQVVKEVIASNMEEGED
jgi:hypothetical protein